MMSTRMGDSENGCGAIPDPAGRRDGDQVLGVHCHHQELEHGTALVIVVTGEADLHSVGPLRAALDGAARDRPDIVVVDLARLRFGDASLLNLVAQAHHRLPRLVLAGPLSPLLPRMLDVTGLAREVRIAPDLATALAWESRATPGRRE